MERFELQHFESEYTGEQIEVIADLNSRKTDTSEYVGTVTYMNGFVRHVGKEVIGYFGNNLVLEGRDTDVIFLQAFFFDGEWTLRERPSVKRSTGTDQLWKSLENFWQSTQSNP